MSFGTHSDVTVRPLKSSMSSLSILIQFVLLEEFLFRFEVLSDLFHF